MAKNTKSIVPQVEKWFMNLLTENGTDFNCKQQALTPEIAQALAQGKSKSGGTGGNYPDYSLMIQDGPDYVPVMIEVKGCKGKLEKRAKDGLLDVGTDAVKNYAVNGAVHYASIVVDKQAVPYPYCIAVGINGYSTKLETVYEASIWFVSKINRMMPIYIGNDYSLLFKKNWKRLVKHMVECTLSEADKEKLAARNETLVADLFKNLNQKMHDEWGIHNKDRIELIAGMVMAGLGTNDIKPLVPEDLKGDTGGNSNDGKIFINKIEDFLRSKSIPQDKSLLISNSLSRVFLNLDLHKPKNGITKLRTAYTFIEAELMPYLRNSQDMGVDFMGRFFNCLTDWAGFSDDVANDCVLTPRYITELMSKLCRVNRTSYVWDYTTGTAGFLVSAMKLMLADAEKIPNTLEREEVKTKIRAQQLLGIELRPEMYMLGVLNMILMGDGSTNILQADSLSYDGTYQQGKKKGDKFPANVFLLNPPYSADGKGFVFVKKALDKMTGGYAAVLIQENAGSGNGLPYTKQLLEKNSLLASIHNADIFKGKAGVQTAIYLFEVGKPHQIAQQVCFVDMTEDGYTRQNRKKASSTVNLRDTDHAVERYQEVVDIIVNRKRPDKCVYYKEGETVFWDSITLDGKDWCVNQHKKVELMPTEADFEKTIADYLAWKVGKVLRGEVFS